MSQSMSWSHGGDSGRGATMNEGETRMGFDSGYLPTAQTFFRCNWSSSRGMQGAAPDGL